MLRLRLGLPIFTSLCFGIFNDRRLLTKLIALAFKPGFNSVIIFVCYLRSFINSYDFFCLYHIPSCLVPYEFAKDPIQGVRWRLEATTHGIVLLRLTYC